MPRSALFTLAAALMIACAAPAHAGNNGMGGHGNSFKLRQIMRGALENSVSLSQDGRANGGAVAQTGDANIAIIRQKGDVNSATITQDGSGNRACLIQKGNGLDGTITQMGDNQATGVLQTKRGDLPIPFVACAAMSNVGRGRF